MFTSTWQRPIVLVVASLALVTGTACAAQASEPQAPAGGTSSVLSGSLAHCVGFGQGGKGGEGGEGGKGGKPGKPGEPGKPGGVGCFRFEDLPDKTKAELTAVDKVQIVMAVLADDSDETKKKIADKYKISTEEIDTWKRQYTEGDWCALMGTGLPFC